MLAMAILVLCQSLTLCTHFPWNFSKTRQPPKKGGNLRDNAYVESLNISSSARKPKRRVHVTGIHVIRSDRSDATRSFQTSLSVFPLVLSTQLLYVMEEG